MTEQNEVTQVEEETGQVAGQVAEETGQVEPAEQKQTFTKNEVISSMVWAYKQGLLDYLSLQLEGLGVLFGDKAVTDNERSAAFSLGAKALFDLANGSYDKIDIEYLRGKISENVDLATSR